MLCDGCGCVQATGWQSRHRWQDRRRPEDRPSYSRQQGRCSRCACDCLISQNQLEMTGDVSGGLPPSRGIFFETPTHYVIERDGYGGLNRGERSRLCGEYGAEDGCVALAAKRPVARHDLVQHRSECKISVRLSACRPSTCSGAMYPTVPSTVPIVVSCCVVIVVGPAGVVASEVLARPKSSNIAPFCVSMMLPGTSDSIRRALRRCLEKDPRRRLADIRDARLDIDDAQRGDSVVSPAPATAPTRAVCMAAAKWSRSGKPLAAAIDFPSFYPMAIT